MSDDRSVGRLLSRAFGVLVALIAGAGLLELAVVLVQHRTVSHLTDQVQPLELANDKVGDLLADAQWSIHSYAMTGDPQMLELYDVSRGAYADAKRDLESRGGGIDDGRAAVQAQVVRAEVWWAVAERQRRQPPRTLEALAVAESMRGLYADFKANNDAFQVRLADRAAWLRWHSEVLWWITVGAVSVITVGATVVAVRTSMRTRSKIVTPLREMTGLLEGRVAGDRQARVAVSGPAEIRAVAAAINAAADQADLVRRHEAQVAARLQALDNAKTDFMSTVSHELRTPLTSISGYLELLRDPETGELSEAQLKMTEVISRNARRLRDLIEDMLTLARIETGEYRTEFGQVDLAEVVERGVAAVGPAAATASVVLRSDVRGPLPARGDGAQLDRALTNLLSNAVKFTPANGTVTVRAERDDDAVTLVVADTGIGIPEAEQQAMFARFFRATNAIRLAIPGTGLGLALVRTIVENHHGEITIDSTENTGTTVTIRLPAEATATARRSPE